MQIKIKKLTYIKAILVTQLNMDYLYSERVLKLGSSDVVVVGCGVAIGTDHASCSR